MTARMNPAEIRAQRAVTRLDRLIGGDSTPNQQIAAPVLALWPGAGRKDLLRVRGLGGYPEASARRLLYACRAALGLKAMNPGPNVPVELTRPDALIRFLGARGEARSGVLIRSPEGVLAGPVWTHPASAWAYGQLGPDGRWHGLADYMDALAAHRAMLVRIFGADGAENAENAENAEGAS
jgi:hypothetical protein